MLFFFISSSHFCTVTQYATSHLIYVYLIHLSSQVLSSLGCPETYEKGSLVSSIPASFLFLSFHSQ